LHREEIYTVSKTDISDSTYLGTPIVSGIAALIYHIILNSGTTILIIVPGQKTKVHILQLSKSGKVVDMYNTMKMAK
jgi:hypothetical protein